MYTIDFTKRKDLSALTDFFKKVYGPKHIMTDSSYLAWQYRDAPGNKHAPRYSNLILKKDETIVGHLGLIPYLLWISGELRHGAYCASLIVDESIRANGPGALLLKEAEKYFDILYTLRANKLARPALSYNHWGTEHFMTRWIYDHSMQNTDNFNNTNIIHLARFEDGWDTAWKNIRPAFPMTIDRSSSYLNWRFVDVPNVSYTIFGYQDIALRGYIVLRLEEGNEFRACRIIDCIADEKSVEPLVQSALAFGAEKKAHFTDFFSFHGVFLSDMFKKNGFYLYDSNINPEPPMFILPTSRKQLTTNVFYKFVKTDDAGFASLPWYMTKADGDRDRPY